MQGTYIRCPRERSRRIALVIAGSVLILGGALPATAARAQAAPGGLCKEAGTHDFAPGLTLMPQQVTAASVGRLTSCQMPDPTIQSGSISFRTVATNLSCLAAAATSPPTTLTITWNNGSSSVAILRVIKVDPEVAIGQVTEGEFAGARVTQVMFHYLADPAEGSACGSPGGLTRILYAGFLEFSVGS
jgi:hypothetical protein